MSAAPHHGQSRHEPFDPDWVIAPGATLREWREEFGVTVEETARACGNTPPDVVRRIEAGEEPIDYARAYMLELGTGISRRLWLNLERNYRRGLKAGKKDAT